MNVTTDDGVGLAVEVAGQGPGLLLVHGFGGAKEDFTEHLPALARDHTVVVFDHRGHGASDKPDDRDAYSLERLASDIGQVADAVGLRTFRLLGHSMGGMVARKVALQSRDRVDALVMMDTCAGPIPGFDPELMDLGAGVARDRGRDPARGVRDRSRRRSFAPVRKSGRVDRRSRRLLGGASPTGAMTASNATNPPTEHGGELAVKALQRHGVDTMFTLSG